MARAFAPGSPMFNRWQGTDDAHRERSLAEAATSFAADPCIAYPDWYLRRWHFLPEGYLSRRSVALYDVVVRNLYNNFAEHAPRRLLVEAIARDQPARVLEVGCGTGWYLRSLAERVPDAGVTGIDLSPFMVERSRDHAGWLPNVDVRHMDGGAIDFSPGTFDTVLMTHVLGHVPPEVAARLLDEAVRVLGPGGRLYTLDHRWHRVAFPAALRRIGTRRWAWQGAARWRVVTS